MEQLARSFDIIDTGFIASENFFADRLFLTCRPALTDYRKQVFPTSFQLQVFFHANRVLWGIHDVKKLVDLEINEIVLQRKQILVDSN